MITVAEVRALAAKRTRTWRGTWAASRIAPAPTDLTWKVALHPPTEREMRTDEHAAEQWTRGWQRFPVNQPLPGAEDGTLPGIEGGTEPGLKKGSPSGLGVTWTSRAWRSIGKQRVPTHAVFTHADAIAKFAGETENRAWRTLRLRADRIASQFGKSDALAAAFKSVAASVLALDDADFDTLIEVALWLSRHDATGLRPRQLPIRGVDTKWFGSHRQLVSALHGAISETPLSIEDADALIRIRLLDTALAPGAPRDFAASPSQLNDLNIRPAFVFVFENLESLLSMPAWPGAAAIHGSGYAVDSLAQIGWVMERPILYWGDLDSHGLAILHRLRTHHPNVTSTLMNETTLMEHRDLWVAEQSPARGSFNTLTQEESTALQRLRDEGNVRLEQERIPWQDALAALHQTADRMPPQGAAPAVE